MKLALQVVFVLAACLAEFAATGRAEDFKLEEGFVSFFNGKDMTGWMIGDVSLDGKAETPGKRFRVSEGNLVTDGDLSNGCRIYTAKKFIKDFHIKFQFQPGAGCNNDLLIAGVKFDLRPKKIKQLKVDEWNDFEIIRIGTKLELKCNGQSLRDATVDGGGTTLLLRAENGPIQFRRFRFKE
jgi:hypothetical protein